jgi:hypothetical protein
MAHDIRGFFCVSWLKGFGIGRCGLQIYDPISQEGHVRKKGVVSVCRTIFNTSNKGIAKHHIDKRKLIQLIKPEILFISYVSTKSFRGFFLIFILRFNLEFHHIRRYNVVRLYWIRYKNFFFHFSNCCIIAN